MRLSSSSKALGAEECGAGSRCWNLLLLIVCSGVSSTSNCLYSGVSSTFNTRVYLLFLIVCTLVYLLYLIVCTWVYLLFLIVCTWVYLLFLIVCSPQVSSLTGRPFDFLPVNTV